jgi:hypothetical protein
MKKLKIDVWHNDEALDWTIEINGLRHEHVTSDVMEALVECALIVAETSVPKALTSLLAWPSSSRPKDHCTCTKRSRL